MQYRNIRTNPIHSRNGRPTSGHCVECGRITSEALGGKRVTTPAQRNGVWVCTDHRGKRNLNDYCDENSVRVGSGNADNISISIELESMGISTHARAYLVSNKFIATHDSTVDIEYKSPIYTSEQPLAKIIGGIEYMNDNDNYKFKVNHEKCGLHTHFGFIDNRYNFQRLRYDYDRLFSKLNSIVVCLSNEDRKTIFGRTWGDYNEPLDFEYPTRHENWINIQHNYSIEIRMPRFISATQYMKFLKTFKKMFKALNTHYISKGAENNVNHEYNADKASRKMCAIFCNAYNVELIDGTWKINNTETEQETSGFTINNNNVTISNDGIRDRMLIFNGNTYTPCVYMPYTTTGTSVTIQSNENGVNVDGVVLGNALVSDIEVAS